VKIDCEIISVESNGESMAITLQGKPPSSAEWRNLERQKIVLPDSAVMRRALYLGRNVTLTMALK
jgi:hypothetical protein